MKNIILTLSFFFLINSITVAQDVRYMKEGSREVQEKENADHIEVIGVFDTVTNLSIVEIYSKNGKLQSRGTSSSDVYIKYEGKRITYFENGKRKEILNYQAGRLQGEAYSYYPSGSLFRVTEYTKDFISTDQIINGNVKIKSLLDSTGKELVTDGKGYFLQYDPDFKYIEKEGPLVNNKWEGEIKGYFSPLELHYVEMYKKGKLVSGISTDKNGQQFSYKIVTAAPSYPGSLPAFYKYMNKALKGHKTDRKGRVFCSFIIDKDGKLLNPEIVRELDPALNEEILLALSKSPLWEPFKQYGIALRAKMDIHLAFNIGSEEVSTIDVPPTTVRNWDGIKYRVN